MIFHRYRAEYTDFVIDLIPLHFTPPEPAMGFGREQIWRITLHNSRKEIGQISYRDGESRCIYYFGHIGYHIDPPYRGKPVIRRTSRAERHAFPLAACGKGSPLYRRTSGKDTISAPSNAGMYGTCRKNRKHYDQRNRRRQYSLFADRFRQRESSAAPRMGM